MSVGISTYLANGWLDTLRNVPFTVPGTFVQLHIGDPGDDGTDNPSVVEARAAMLLTTAATGAITATGAPASFDMTAAETITHISVWSGYDGDEAAEFLWSAVIRVPRTVANGDTVNLNDCDLELLTRAA